MLGEEKTGECRLEQQIVLLTEKGIEASIYLDPSCRKQQTLVWPDKDGPESGQETGRCLGYLPQLLAQPQIL